MERFLRYSLEHQRAIRLIFLAEDGTMKQATAVVEAMDDGCVTIATQRPKARHTLSLGDILSADYRRGDEGQE